MSKMRERKLLSLIQLLWHELTPTRQEELLPSLGDVRWAIPVRPNPHVDDLLTEDELAAELGMTIAAIRNWPRRYPKYITLVDGKYRWGDVDRMLFDRRVGNLKKAS